MRYTVLVVCAVLLLSASTLAENPRVFITDSKSWEISGSSGGANGAFGGSVHGGARPQTAEIIKTFGERCPNVTINNKLEKADYVVVLDHEGGKGWVRKDNKVAVFNSDGDSIMSHSTRSLGGSVQDACAAIAKDWEAIGSKPRPKEAVAAPPAPVVAAPIAKAPDAPGKITVASQPPNADIEIDGSFVGNTPSAIAVTPGEHTIVVKKSGYKDWERKVKFAGGEITLSPELEKVAVQATGTAAQ